jgi:glucose/arabinose dehydrogenase
LTAAGVTVLGSEHPGPAKAGDGHGGIAKRRIGSFAAPTYVTHAPGAPRFLYVVERAGRVRVVDRGHVRGRPFLDIHRRVSTQGERGLLSIAFDPHYPRDHLVYAYYTNGKGNIEIDEFHAASNARAREGSRRRVIVVPHPGASNHNGGTLAFGPDGKLYLAPDGGAEGDPHENAQDKHRLLGKVLRIDPHRHHSKPYTVPRGNPYVGKRGRNEIYALGLRNPFRFSFDHGRILSGDVGQDHWEEVDYERHKSLRGANFGWNHFEGRHVFRAATHVSRRHYEPPIFEYAHSGSKCASAGGCAITGGVVVHNRRLRSLRGRYLYADFYKGQLRSFVPRRHHAERDRALGVHVDHPTSFGEGSRGKVYVSSLNGPVYRLVHK